MHPTVVGVHLTAALVDRHEHRLDATGCLRHEARCACRRNGETRDVASSALHHAVIEGGIGLLNAQDERVVLLAVAVVYREGATLLCHLHRAGIGGESQCFVYADAEVGSLLCAITQTHGGNHVALSRYAHTRAASLAALRLDFLPQMQLGTFHLIALRVAFDLCYDSIDLLQFEIYDVVHHALCNAHMLLEEVIIKLCLRCERVFHIAVEVDAQQTARVVWAERNLSTRVCAHRAEAEVGIAVGDALTQDSIPEEHARLGTLPCVMHNFLPQDRCRYLLFHQWVVRVDRKLLRVGFVVHGSLHKLVVELHRHVSARDLALRHLCVDERFAVGVLYAHAQHESAATAILCHLACGVAVTLHEGHKTC